MILTCPQCAARFSLEAELLAPNGRKVRCAACKHTWHQLPDPAELPGGLPSDDDDDIAEGLARLEQQAETQDKPRFEAEDIPKALRPDLAGDVPEVQTLSGGRRRLMLSAIGGILAVLLPTAILLACLQSSVVRIWPASYALYEAVGLAKPVAGEGLIFEKMKADVRKNDKGALVLHIEGQVINLRNEAQPVPMIEAILKGEGGEIYPGWLIAPPQRSIKAEGLMPFTADTEFKHEKAVSVTLRFLSGETQAIQPSKTVSGGGENTPAPPAADITLPSDHEGVFESPPPSAAPLHPESQPAHTENSGPPSGHP